jgi:hypothetical protein
MLLMVIVVALCATQAVVARTHHRAPKTTTPALATKPGTAIIPEKNRHPEDVALDRRIKGICRGC